MLKPLIKRTTLTLALAALVPFQAHAAADRSLAYPTGTLSADELADQVYFVNHFFAFDNYAIVKDGKDITVLVLKSAGKKPTTITLERYLNNKYEDDPNVKAKDLAIFRSGKLRGTGMLITEFDDQSKSQSYAVWLPSLRKIRRFAEPAHDDAWGGSDFTFGDVTLRRPQDEKHELVGEDTFNDCLGAMELKDSEKNRYTRKLPKAYCGAKGRAVYKLKSTPKRSNWWYDYRISYVDKETFADHRTEYFKGGKQIKVIDRHWEKAPGVDDPRAVSWGYWYGKNLDTGHETWAVIPSKVNRYNDSSFKSSKWSEATLRKLKQ